MNLLVSTFVDPQGEHGPSNGKQGNKPETVAVVNEQSGVNGTKETTKTSESPSIRLDPSSILGGVNSGNHDSVQDNIGKTKTKRRKRTKKNNDKKVVQKPVQKAVKKSTKRKAKSNLKSSRKKKSKSVASHSPDKLERPRETHDTTVEGDFSGSNVLGFDEIISEDIGGTNEQETQYGVHDEKVQVAVDEQSIAFEHFALIVEEYLLATDVM